MVKGLSRRVIVVDSPDPHIFEQAIFIVRNDAAVGSGGVTSQQVVDQAIRIAKDYARTHGAPPRRRLRMSPWLAALLGGAAIGAVWLLAMLLSYHFSPHLGADGVSRSALPFCPGAAPLNRKPADLPSLWRMGSAIFRLFQSLCMVPEILYQNFHNFLLRIFSVYDKILDESFNENGLDRKSSTEQRGGKE